MHDQVISRSLVSPCTLLLSATGKLVTHSITFDVHESEGRCDTTRYGLVMAIGEVTCAGAPTGTPGNTCIVLGQSAVRVGRLAYPDEPETNAGGMFTHQVG